MLTEAELDRRRRFITATDVPAIVGAYPKSFNRNAGDVFRMKVDGISTFKGNAATEVGNFLEPSILAWAKEEIGEDVLLGDWCVHENGINAASLDGITASGEPVEAKTSGILGPHGASSEWGDEMTDEIPDYYLLQVQSQLLVKRAKRCWVPALLGGRGFVLFVVPANRDLQEFIRETSEQFWHEHVEPKVPPTEIPSFETLKVLKRVPDKTVVVPDELAMRVNAANELAKIAEKRSKELKAELVNALGDAECATWSGGEFTYHQQDRAGYTVKPTSFRVLRHKAQKGSEEPAAPDYQSHLRRELVAQRLHVLGYRLKDESPSGSRYYCAIGKPEVRLSDHAPNEATALWMSRQGVVELRWDHDDDVVNEVLLQISQAQRFAHAS